MRTREQCKATRNQRRPFRKFSIFGFSFRRGPSTQQRRQKVKEMVDSRPPKMTAPKFLSVPGRKKKFDGIRSAYEYRPHTLNPSESDQASAVTTIAGGPLKSWYEIKSWHDCRSDSSLAKIPSGSADRSITISGPRGVRMTRSALMRQEWNHLLLNGWGKWKTLKQVGENDSKGKNTNLCK